MSASTGNEIALGRFRFRVAYRTVEGDGGLTIHVFGPRAGAEEEVLRFDCFRDCPHYHLGWSYRDERFIEIQSADPFSWSVSEIRSNLNALLRAAVADPLRETESAGLGETCVALERLGEAVLAANADL